MPKIYYSLGISIYYHHLIYHENHSLWGYLIGVSSTTVFPFGGSPEVECLLLFEAGDWCSEGFDKGAWSEIDEVLRGEFRVMWCFCNLLSRSTRCPFIGECFAFDNKEFPSLGRLNVFTWREGDTLFIIRWVDCCGGTRGGSTPSCSWKRFRFDPASSSLDFDLFEEEIIPLK